MRLILAFRAFFAVLFRPDAARFIERVLDSAQGKSRDKKSKSAEKNDEKLAGPALKSVDSDTSKSKSAPITTGRSDALTLLSTLQREARFLDLVQESLDEYSDAQVGATARDVIRDCGKVLQRCFHIQPLLSEAEGSTVAVSSTSPAVRYRIVGKPVSNDNTSATLLHSGWQAAVVQLPQWIGAKEDQMVLAPAEVEVT